MPTHAKDETGKKYGSWTVLSKVTNQLHKTVYWLCRCDCGREQEVDGGALRSGYSTRCRSCSSKQAQITYVARGYKPGRLSHGHCRNRKPTPEYWSFQNAKARCEDPNEKLYAGRGIKFLFTSFEQFLAEVGERPEPKREYSIDRIDNDGNYEPGNVRWATATEQRLNQKPEELITGFRNHNGLRKTI